MSERETQKTDAGLLRSYGPSVPAKPEASSPQRYDLVQINACYTTDHEMERSADGEWVRFDDVAAVSMPAQWMPIETLDMDEKALLWAPRWRLWGAETIRCHPDIAPGEMRVSARRDWTWATHWTPLPMPPAGGE